MPSFQKSFVSLQSNTPVAIGGVGGSGTRVVSGALINLRFYMGAALNNSLDNLWFTILLKNPLWFEKLPSEETIIHCLNLFKKSMTQGLHNNSSEIDSNYILRKASISKSHNLPIPKEYVDKLLQSGAPDAKEYRGWGWKEPNTHIFLPQIFKAFDQAKYIHVIRNGLDMAFSNNQNQCHYWGKQFDVWPNSNNQYTPSLFLDYWIAANQRAIDFGMKYQSNRFYLLSYDELCRSPVQELNRLIKFLDIELDSNQVNDLASMIKSPSSIGRHQQHSLDQFSCEQLRRVEELSLYLNP